MQSEQLPTESQVFEDEVLAGAQRADDPPEEMPERHNHDKNNIGTIRIQLFCQVIHFAGVRRFGEAHARNPDHRAESPVALTSAA